MVNDMAIYEQLLTEVEKKFNKPLIVNGDFITLAKEIKQVTGSSISCSTLKRYWNKKDPGRFVSNHIRMSTLDILSRYLGYRSFDTYERQERINPKTTSHPLSTQELRIADLAPEKQIRLKWAPDRDVVIRHNEGNSFTVITSDNSKLLPRDTFEVSHIISHCPLILTNLRRSSISKPANYICGQDCSLEFEVLD